MTPHNYFPFSITDKRNELYSYLTVFIGRSVFKVLMRRDNTNRLWRATLYTNITLQHGITVIIKCIIAITRILYFNNIADLVKFNNTDTYVFNIITFKRRSVCAFVFHHKTNDTEDDGVFIELSVGVK